MVNDKAMARGHDRPMQANRLPYTVNNFGSLRIDKMVPLESAPIPSTHQIDIDDIDNGPIPLCQAHNGNIASDMN